ncbi:MAG TPA: BON domain-containing protein [Alphaproteobacteria bacterium]|jgi:osmotically-inducible protein OsmY|nr:BON domain-containing protein [Alphaproteobacteria bacterium]
MKKTSPGGILQAVRKAVHSERLLDRHVHLELTFKEGVLTLEGEVHSVAAKKLCLERAASVPGVVGIVDRLRVRAATAMHDHTIRSYLLDALVAEPTLSGVELIESENDRMDQVREGDSPDAWIAVQVLNGIVMLDGEVPSLARKRMAGVLAWWVPGTRDVVNSLRVLPPERDSDAGLAKVVLAVLEKDPFVDANRVRVATKAGGVRLDGVVPTEMERDMAEFDTWCVFGVGAVENHIAVRPTAGRGSS